MMLINTDRSAEQTFQTAEIPPFAKRDQRKLLCVAVRSIQHGFRSGKPLPVNLNICSRRLRERRACFVTLRIDGALRGCTGSIVSRRSFVQEVAINALMSAFDDPRFPPLFRDEFFELDIRISALSPLVPIEFDNEVHLLTQLRPNIDGLVLDYGSFGGVFLPDVWNELPEPENFFSNLKRKAGLTAAFWSDELTVRRFTTQAFGGPVQRIVDTKAWRDVISAGVAAAGASRR